MVKCFVPERRKGAVSMDELDPLAKEDVAKVREEEEEVW